MSLQQKMRLLSHFMPAGFPHFMHENRDYLYLLDVPYELESIFSTWLARQPENLLVYDAPDGWLIRAPKGIAVSQAGWEEFVYWMAHTLREKLSQAEFESQKPSIAQKPDSDQ